VKLKEVLFNINVDRLALLSSLIEITSVTMSYMHTYQWVYRAFFVWSTWYCYVYL